MHLGFQRVGSLEKGNEEREHQCGVDQRVLDVSLIFKTSKISHYTSHTVKTLNFTDLKFIRFRIFEKSALSNLSMD